jgi:hypothetical protein
MKLLILKKENTLLSNRYLQIGLLYILSFAIPFILRGPQLIVGTTINFVLILGISQFKFKEMIPSLVLPSFAVYTYSLLFGGATHFLIYLIPIITISNAIYVTTWDRIQSKESKIFLSSILKTSFLFLATYILVKTVGLPEMFLTTMGIIQLITSISGATLATILLEK